jgi:hypothetical protein
MPMPGMGGSPPFPMAGPGLPGMPGPAPFGPDPAAMQALSGVGETPSPQREEDLLSEALLKIGVALAHIHMRSPKAAKLLSDAQSKISQAREELKKEQPVGLPPDLLGGMMPGGPSGGGMSPPMM